MRLAKWQFSPEGLDFLQPPDQDIQLSRKVQQWTVFRKNNSRRQSHAVYLDFSFSIVERPWLVMDFSAVHLTLLHRVEAVALGEPMFESAFLAQPDLAGRPV